jgi:hypothetical protein
LTSMRDALVVLPVMQSIVGCKRFAARIEVNDRSREAGPGGTAPVVESGAPGRASPPFGHLLLRVCGDRPEFRRR